MWGYTAVIEQSICGFYNCAQCKFCADETCLGCKQGNAFLEQWGRTPCKIYACARSQGLENCKDCSNAVCRLRNSTDHVCPLRAGIEDKKDWAWRIAKHLDERGTPCHDAHAVPLKALMRLHWYLGALESMAERGIDVISSRELADKVGVNAAMVRKDLSYLGELGTPGLGYRVSYLHEKIQGLLSRNTCLVVWVGAQWLSNALDTFTPSTELNFRIVAVLDTKKEWVGQTVGEWEVLPLSDISALLANGGVDGAVLAVMDDARRISEALVDAGVKGILNLTPVTLTTPPEVSVRHVDLLGEMMALARQCSDG